MSYRIRITFFAIEDMRSNHQWWFKNRSEAEADRWLIGIDKQIRALSSTANSETLATEVSLRKAEIRQATFGLGRKPSHRILFAIKGTEVVVYRIRAFKQDLLELDDLS